MSPALRMRQYERQAIASATPEQLIAKLYNIGVSACHNGDRQKLRAVLVELTSSLDFEAGGELAGQLYALYDFALRESATGDLTAIGEILSGLRDAWAEGVLAIRAAA